MTLARSAELPDTPPKITGSPASVSPPFSSSPYSNPTAAPPPPRPSSPHSSPSPPSPAPEASESDSGQKPGRPRKRAASRSGGEGGCEGGGGGRENGGACNSSLHAEEAGEGAKGKDKNGQNESKGKKERRRPVRRPAQKQHTHERTAAETPPVPSVITSPIAPHAKGSPSPLLFLPRSSLAHRTSYLSTSTSSSYPLPFAAPSSESALHGSGTRAVSTAAAAAASGTTWITRPTTASAPDAPARRRLGSSPAKRSVGTRPAMQERSGCPAAPTRAAARERSQNCTSAGSAVDPGGASDRAAVQPVLSPLSRPPRPRARARAPALFVLALLLVPLLAPLSAGPALHASPRADSDVSQREGLDPPQPLDAIDTLPFFGLASRHSPVSRAPARLDASRGVSAQSRGARRAARRGPRVAGGGPDAPAHVRRPLGAFAPFGASHKLQRSPRPARPARLARPAPRAREEPGLAPGDRDQRPGQVLLARLRARFQAMGTPRTCVFS